MCYFDIFSNCWKTLFNLPFFSKEEEGSSVDCVRIFIAYNEIQLTKRGSEEKNQSTVDIRSPQAKESQKQTNKPHRIIKIIPTTILFCYNSDGFTILLT